TGSAHDRVVGVDSEGRKEGMHRSAEPSIEAGFAREDFAVGSIDEEADGQAPYVALISALHGPQQRTIQIGAHNRHQLAVAQTPNCREAFSENLAVAAVRSEDVILGAESESHPDGRGLLANGKMSRAGVIVGYGLVGAFGFDLVEAGLKFANGAHVLP